jgi:hypothetical protein
VNKKNIAEKKKTLKETKMYTQKEYEKAMEETRKEILSEIDREVAFSYHDPLMNPMGPNTLSSLFFRTDQLIKVEAKYDKLRSDIFLIPNWLKKLIKFVTGTDIERNL